MNEKTFLELAAECEMAQAPLGLSFEEALGGMEGAGIGIARLSTDETVALRVTEGYIARGTDRIAKIPNFDVLKSAESIRDFINTALKGEVVSVEMI